MATVQQTVESGIIPIVIELNDVVFFESSERLSRTFLTINSLDLGVLGYPQYRFVAHRTKQAYHLTERHLTKLMRIIPTLVVERPEISCYIVPVYARLLKSGELVDILLKALALYPEAYAGRVCIELSCDVLFEDLDEVRAAMEQIRSMGFKTAISEVGDTFCPVFRVAELPLDYVFLDPAVITRLTADDAGERVVGSFISYLKDLGTLVFAPDAYDEATTAALRRVGCDGCVGSIVSGEDVVPADEIADETADEIAEEVADETAEETAVESTEDAPLDEITVGEADADTAEIGGDD